MGLRIRGGPKWEEDILNHINKTTHKINLLQKEGKISLTPVTNPYLARKGRLRDDE
jgi:hypothetical protein